MFDNYKLCDTLKPSDTCFVAEEYDKGEFVRKFHEHVPKSRLSADARTSVLRALVMHFSGIGPKSIVCCHLNKRGRTPAFDNSLRMVVSFPELGVLRTYCGANTKAWSDQVIVPTKFRISPTE
jgi:hypothetical protein